MPNLIQKNTELNIQINTIQTDSILYFLNNNRGELVSSETIQVKGDSTTITISEEITKNLGIGGNDLKVFAISTSVLKPDFYSTSFLVTANQDRLPEITKTEIQFIQEQQIVFWILIPVIILIIVIILFLKRRK